MKKVKISIVFLFLITLISCDSRTYDEISGESENPTYTKNIKPIFDSKCSACHFYGNPDGLSSFSNYAETRQGIEFGDVLYYVDTLGTMPKNSTKLPNETIQLLYNWKEDGYPEN